MKHLIIYAHPSINSFSFKLKDAIINQIKKRGEELVLRDLYELDFDPVLRPGDLGQLKKGVTPPEILAEQEYLKDADMISIIYPLWWAGFPAILKGWIDKVLAYGFAYEMSKDGIVGKLKGKRVSLYTSMGNSLEQYEEKNLLEAFKQIHGEEIFEFCGMEVSIHKFFPQIPDASEDVIKQHIDESIEEFKEMCDNL